MKKFLALYMAPQALIETWGTTSPEEKKKGMDEWMAWADAHKADLVELGTPVGSNKKVSGSGVSEEKNEIVGYSIVQAESHEAAAEMMKSNPHVKQDGAWIDILECMKM